MQRALHNAQVSPADVAYLNAHATSTPLGDEAEAKAVHNLFVPSSEPIHHTLGSCAMGMPAYFGKSPYLRMRNTSQFVEHVVLLP